MTLGRCLVTGGRGFIGARLVKKLTIVAIQRTVSVLLVIVGIGLISGFL